MVLHFTVWKIFLSPPSVATTHLPLLFVCLSGTAKLRTQLYFHYTTDVPDIDLVVAG